VRAATEGPHRCASPALLCASPILFRIIRFHHNSHPKPDLRPLALVERSIEWNNATLFHAIATLSIFRAHQPPSGPNPSPARADEAELTQQFQVVEEGSFGRRAIQTAVYLLKSSLPAIGQDLQDVPLPFSQVVTDSQRCSIGAREEANHHAPACSANSGSGCPAATHQSTI